jgi:hypothetical protein
MDWVERADALLYDGETVEREVRVGEGGVVVTTHRVLAFTPDRDGANYRAVDRPNVEGVGVTTTGEGAFLEQGVKALVAGVVLVGAGQVISLDGIVAGISIGGGQAASAVGIGGLLGMVQTLLTLLAQLDDIMRLFGGLALALAAVVLGVYAWSRERVLVVDVAGDDDVVLSAPDDEAVVEQLEAAVRPGDAPAGAVRSTGDDPLA